MSESLLRCAFCKKPRQEVRKLIAGTGVCICDDCVDICNDILEEDLAGELAHEVQVTRTVSLPARHLHTGIALLVGAIRVIHGSFPRSSSVFTLDVHNLTLTLKVRTTEAMRVTVDEALTAYGTVLQGKTPPATLLDLGGVEGMRLKIEDIKADLPRAASEAGDPDQLLRVLGWILCQEIEDVEEFFS